MREDEVRGAGAGRMDRESAGRGRNGNGIYAMDSNLGMVHLHGCSGAKGYFHVDKSGLEPMDCPECKSHLSEHDAPRQVKSSWTGCPRPSTRGPRPDILRVTSSGMCLL